MNIGSFFVADSKATKLCTAWTNDSRGGPHES